MIRRSTVQNIIAKVMRTQGPGHMSGVDQSESKRLASASIEQSAGSAEVKNR
jgi:hypothetical protein